MATAITETDVWKAADALLLEGLRPTIERVRQKIGRGSPNTVSPYLETWFKSLGARIKDPGAFSAPAALPDPIHQAAKHFWETALAEARATLAVEATALQEALVQEQAALGREREALAGRQKALDGQIAAQAEALELARSQGAEAQHRSAQMEEQLRREQAERARQVSESESLRQKLEALGKTLEAARVQAAAERADLEKHFRANETRWMEEVDRAREDTRRLEKMLGRATSEATHQALAHTAECNRLEGQLQAAERERSQLASELAQAKAGHESNARAFEAATLRETELNRRLERLETQLENTFDALREKDREHAQTLSKLVASSAAQTKESARTMKKSRTRET